MNAAVGSARDEQALAVDDGHDRYRVISATAANVGPPDRRAAIRIKPHDPFLLARPLSGVADDVDSAIHDQRRGSAAIGLLPKAVTLRVTGIGREALGQIFLARHAVLLRPAPVRPVV